MPEYDTPPVDYYPEPDVLSASDGAVMMSAPTLEPCEKEILGFILESGCEPLQFDRDSRFYVSGEDICVAEFIDGVLAEDDARFYNEPYRRVYDEYFRMYDEGLSQEVIIKRLLDSMDPVIASVANDILIAKYQITVKNYEASLTSRSTRLVQFVPKAMLVYQKNKVELLLKDLMARLATADEAGQEDILKQISDYNRAKTRLNKELGRV